MQRISATCLLLGVLPLLAEEAVIDSHEGLPGYFPQHYRSLADVPEQYHDGEKLTGCFILDSVRFSRPRVSCPPVVQNPNLRIIDVSAGPSEGHRKPDPPKEEIICHNPFYWDEHGRIKNFLYGGDPSAKPPLGLPLGFDSRDSQSSPCEGCLNEEQVLDVFRVYHGELGIEPLGYRASLVRGYPWNGISHPDFCDKYDLNYLDSLHPDPRGPHTNEHNQHKRDWPRTPCTISHFIHAQTGRVVDRHDHPTNATTTIPARAAGLPTLRVCTSWLPPTGGPGAPCIGCISVCSATCRNCQPRQSLTGLQRRERRHRERGTQTGKEGQEEARIR